VGIVSTVWFTIGGTIDLKRLFKRLREKETNILDDGRVIGHISSGDTAALVDKGAAPDAAELIKDANVQSQAEKQE